MKNPKLGVPELVLAIGLISMSAGGCTTNLSARPMDGKLRVTAVLDCTNKGVAISFALQNGTDKEETMPDMALPWARGFIATRLEIRNEKTGEIIRGVPPISDYFGDTTIPARRTLRGQVRLNLLFDDDKLLSLEKGGEATVIWAYSGKTNSGVQVDANGELSLSKASGGPSCN